MRDMWLTGLDAPAMHTMYIDKPMQGAGLVLAIARLNRTFRDKPGGLIVDYLRIAPDLRKALAEYSPTDRDQAGVPIAQIVAVILEKHDIVHGILYGLAWSSNPGLPADKRLPQLWNEWTSSSPTLTARAVSLDQVLALAKAANDDPQRRQVFPDVRSDD